MNFIVCFHPQEVGYENIHHIQVDIYIYILLLYSIGYMYLFIYLFVWHM